MYTYTLLYNEVADDIYLTGIVKRVFYEHPPKIDEIRLRNTANPLLSVQIYTVHNIIYISVRRNHLIYTLQTSFCGHIAIDIHSV